jgi:hypothetical protein
VGEDRTGPQSGHRVSEDEAARHLGLTVDAVRKRVQRGQIAYEKDAAGRVRIILDERETLQDESPDSTGQRSDARGVLIDELRDRLRYVERQLEAERRANEENRRLLAALIQRVPELEAAQKPPEEPQTPTPQPGRVEPQATIEGAQEGTQRPWWQRWFGG